MKLPTHISEHPIKGWLVLVPVPSSADRPQLLGACEENLALAHESLKQLFGVTDSQPPTVRDLVTSYYTMQGARVYPLLDAATACDFTTCMLTLLPEPADLIVVSETWAFFIESTDGAEISVWNGEPGSKVAERAE